MNDSPLTWIAIGLALLAWGICTLIEAKRYGRGRRLALRSFLLFIAVAALFMLWLKPLHSTPGAATTILLNGRAEEPLDSLLEVYPAARVLSLEPHPQYPLLEGLSYLSQKVAPGSSVFLVGAGVAEEELPYLEPYSLTYVPAKGATGILTLSHTTTATAADTIRVQGVWHATTSANKLLLALGGVGLDSSTAERAGHNTFKLKTPAGFSADRVYYLYWLHQNGDTLASQRLPVEVHDPELLQLGLLTAYPEPESKYLKEMLARQGHRLYYAAQLAPGKEVREWVNLPRQPIVFTEKGLSSWDLLIQNTAYYSALENSKKGILHRAIQQEGIGLLLYADAETKTVSWQGSPVQFAQEVVRDTITIGGTIVPLEYRPLYNIPEGWQVMHEGNKGIISIRRRFGLGQVVVSGSVASYRLLLGGMEEAYQQLWYRLIKESLPLAEKNTEWELPLTATKHLPASLALYSNDSLPVFQVLDPEQQPVEMPVWQSEEIPHKWWLQFWPRQKGWHTAIAAGDTALFWVEDSVSSIVNAKRRFQLKHLLQAQGQRSPLTAAYEKKPVKAWPFYLLFVISMGGLWLEKKLKG